MKNGMIAGLLVLVVIAGLLVLVVIAAVCLGVAVRGPETAITTLEKQNVELRVIAENRELLWRVAVLEDNLKKMSQQVKPVPGGAPVDIQKK